MLIYSPMAILIKNGSIMPVNQGIAESLGFNYHTVLDTPDQEFLPGNTGHMLIEEWTSYAKKIITDSKYDIIILDEINVAVDFKLIDLNEVLHLLDEKPEPLELILTGRYAHPDIIKKADLVTEMLEIKHPYQKGILSRKGIDY